MPPCIGTKALCLAVVRLHDLLVSFDRAYPPPSYCKSYFSLVCVVPCYLRMLVTVRWVTFYFYWITPACGKGMSTSSMKNLHDSSLLPPCMLPFWLEVCIPPNWRACFPFGHSQIPDCKFSMPSCRKLPRHGSCALTNSFRVAGTYKCAGCDMRPAKPWLPEFNNSEPTVRSS